MPLNTNFNTDVGDDQYPTVVTDGKGTWVTIWSSRENLHGKTGGDRDILVARSTDNGETWTPPALLNTNGFADETDDFIPQLATDRAGTWMAVWWSGDDLSDTAGTDKDILFSTSVDDGRTWTDPALVNTNGVSDLGDDYVPYIATDLAGTWMVVWDSTDAFAQGRAGTDFDIFATTIRRNLGESD